MASFTEFLKSGKSAREFIDTAVLPDHARPVARTESSPEPYVDEELGGVTEIPTPQTDDLTGADADDQAHDVTNQAILESEGDADADFMRKLEALERTTL